MTDAEIISLAYDCNAMPECCTDAGLVAFWRLAFDMGSTQALEKAAAMVEADLWPGPVLNGYKAQYNNGIAQKAMQIRGLKS